MSRAISFVAVAVCAFLSGCNGSETIWSAESRSPDGKMLASARTIARSGFGTGAIDTEVYLKWSRSSPPVLVLGFSYESEFPVGITAVEMKWLTPTHLEVAYKGHATLGFQAVKCSGVDISVRDLSGDAASLKSK
jgi:hypothetical protein